MTTLFLLVMGVCQSLNELGVASVTKKWSGQNRTSRTACYGPEKGEQRYDLIFPKHKKGVAQVGGCPPFAP